MLVEASSHLGMKIVECKKRWGREFQIVIQEEAMRHRYVGRMRKAWTKETADGWGQERCDCLELANNQCRNS